MPHEIELAAFALLRVLWIEREKMHDILDEFWDKNPHTDALIEEISEGRDNDTLLAQLRVLAVEQEWAIESPMGLIPQEKQ